jgi:hypothetical protein
VLVLLAGTGLLVNSFARLVVFDFGFDALSRGVTLVTNNTKHFRRVSGLKIVNWR